MMMDVAVPQSHPAAAGVHHSDIDDGLSPMDRPERVGYQTSPHAPNTPENNICKLVEYRSAKVASFTVNGRELICLPQAFELFLKHLVGGLHTVYTKLKRLEITPVVCNVEQVRILRGVAAIQPGVNRCKLISPDEFDVLYEDCTSSSARPGRPPKRSSHFLSEMNDVSPSKLVRKSSEPMFPFDELKHMSGIQQGILPPPQHGGYSLPLPGMPFVSPFQINLMQQAAVHMALANQIQHANIARAKETPPTLHHDMNTSKTQAIREGQLQMMTAPHPVNLSPTASMTEQKYQVTEQRKSLDSSSEQKGHRTHTHSPVSTCSEDLIVDSHTGPVLSPQQVQHSRTPPHASHSNNTITPTRASPITHAAGHTHSLVSTSGRPASSPNTQPTYSHTQYTSAESHQGHPANREDSTPQRSVSPPLNVTDHHISTEPSEGNTARNLDHILTGIKSDIRSFMDSVIQHQEDIISDIETLRNSLKTQPCSADVIETFMKEQQQTKAMYQAQIEKENIHKQQIDNLLRLAKTDVHNNQWWNRNPSLH